MAKYLTVGQFRKLTKDMRPTARIRFTTDDLAQWTTHATDALMADADDALVEDPKKATRVIIFGGRRCE